MAELTEERLAELRRLCEAATPGPWSVRGDARPDYYGNCYWWIRGPEGYRYVVCNDAQSAEGGVTRREDAEFIAAAREALPALIDEVGRLRRRVEALERVVVAAIKTADTWAYVAPSDDRAFEDLSAEELRAMLMPVSRAMTRLKAALAALDPWPHPSKLDEQSGGGGEERP